MKWLLRLPIPSYGVFTESRQSTTAKQYITVDNNSIILVIYLFTRGGKHMEAYNQYYIDGTQFYEQIMQQIKGAVIISEN